MEKERSERFKRGWEKLKAIDGEAGENVVANLKDVSPELITYIIEYSFGDIYSRTGLDDKTKEIAVVAALTAMGNVLPQLKVHLHGALNTGSSISEIKEVILQMAVYSGFPSCINGMNILKEVLQERRSCGIHDNQGRDATADRPEDRLTKGKKELSVLDDRQLVKMEAAYNELSPELVRYVVEFGYGDIFARDNLNKKYRQVATIAALTALGSAAPQLKFHINAALTIGVTAEQIKEIMLLMTVFAGFPAAINGMFVLKNVISERTT